MATRYKIKPEVYYVSADTCYDGSAVLCAFWVRAHAEAFAQACRDHDAKQPQSPDYVDTPEGNAAHDKWYRAQKRWEKKHLAGEAGASNDGYSVHALEVR